MALKKDEQPMKPADDLPSLGWREWVSLPELGINKLKAKVDTGARTSALHAFAVMTFSEHGRERVQFDIHPIQRDSGIIITCAADVIDKRYVTDSGGHKEKRIVISTPVTVGDQTWNIEVTLTDRDPMLFRMLLGRSALHNRYTVNPAESFLMTGKDKK